MAIRKKYANRGQAAQDCIDRWFQLEREAAPLFGDQAPQLSMRQMRTLKLQIRAAIVRWEASRDSG